jgi:phosphoserine phosphatase
MAERALRVLAVAGRSDATPENAERGMTFLGLVGMIDPPRAEAGAAIQTCEGAGIRVVMITGDHPITARAIARELGVLKQGRVVSGSELEAMSDADFDADVDTIDVYARATPAHKLRVVTALQKQGHVVAMTGDGVNDAPALKKADIGIAMGVTGTDVAREAAAMTLTDDNFASIVAAVEEGRGIFGNIKKYLMFLLSSNLGEIGLMAGATLLGLPLPVTAVQILYVNLATDGLPALALAVDPPEPDLMRRPPRNPRIGIFTRPVVRRGQPRNVRLVARFRPHDHGIHDDDLCHAGRDPVHERVQLPVRPDFDLATPVRQSVAESGRLLGARAAAADHLSPVPAKAVRHVQPAADGLGRRDRRCGDDRARDRAGEMDGAAGLVRGDELAARAPE